MCWNIRGSCATAGNGGDNATGADDQQERLREIEESSETVRRAPHQTPMTEMRQSELHGDMQSGYSIPPLSNEAQQMNGPKVAKFLVG